VGGGIKTGSKLYIYNSINLHGGEIRFANLIKKGIELWQLDLKKIIYLE